VFQGRIHELAEQYFQQKGLPTGRLDAAIHHFGKVDTQRDAIKQREYTRLAKEEVRCHPEDPMAHYNLVQQALRVEDWEAVRDSAKAYLCLVERVPMMIYLGAAKACLHLGEPAASLPFLDAMLGQQPGHAVALDARGEVLAKLGRLDEAQASFLAALDSDPGFTLPFLHLSRLLDEDGNHANARSVLEAGLDQNPQDLALWTALVGRSAAREPGRAAGDAWDAIQALPEGGEGVWHLLVIHALLAQGEQADARLVLARGLKSFPNHPELKAMARRLES
jgi:tetratricopeptide (TPR) repeat protein